MTATETSPAALLDNLTASLEAATAVLNDTADRFLPPADGISLLDLKNDLLLSYLQNLVFLILFKIDNSTASSDDSIQQDQYTSTAEKLIELRVYLERGVRPVEQRLKYTIDQSLQAANLKKTTTSIRSSTGHVRGPSAADDSGSEASDDDVTPPVAHEDQDASGTGPRLAQIATGPFKTAGLSSSSPKTGIYKPPRLNPTAMPSSDPDARSRGQPRQRKSQLMSEYIDEELSNAPNAQPSIGSNQTITVRGNGISSRDIARQRERTDYEETNFTRLPGDTKKEKREKKKREAREGGRDMFGGEDWTGLGGLGDRIGRSVESGKNNQKDSMLKRREKRRATDDLPRGDGLQIGDTFAKKQKVLARRADKKTSKRR